MKEKIFKITEKYAKLLIIQINDFPMLLPVKIVLIALLYLTNNSKYLEREK